MHLESLDELEEIVTELFSEVKNKEIVLPVWPEHPFNENHFQTKWYVVPIKDTRNLNIVFPLPDLRNHYKSAVIIIFTYQHNTYLRILYYLTNVFVLFFTACILYFIFVRTRRKGIIIVYFKSKGIVQFACLGKTTRCQRL